MAIRLASESKPQLAMPMNVRPPTSPRSSARDRAGGEHRARRHRLERDPEHAGEVVAAAAGEHAEHAVGVPERAGDRADQPSPPNATAISPAAAAARASSRACSRLRVRSTWCSSPSRLSAASTAGSARAGAAAAGRGVDDQRQPHVADAPGRAGRRRSRPGRDRWRPRPAPRLVTPVSTIARVEPGRGRAGEVGVEPIADDQRAARAEAVERGLEDLRVGLADDASPSRSVAYSSAATIAPVPGHSPSSVGNVRSRPAAIISAPASTAWVAVAQLGEVEARRGRRRRRRRPRRPAAVPLTIRCPASATWRKIAGEPIT